MEGPRIVKKEEFPELLELVDICFPVWKPHGGMLRCWPHCYDLDRLENNTIIKKDNRIVSHIGCIPQDVKIGTGKVKVGGISGVATLPDYRGQGLMSTLLKYTIARMKENKFALSDLGGDRQRYGHFGWENGAREWVFYINKRSLGQENIKWEIKKYEGDKNDLETIIQIHNREKFGVIKSRRLYEILFDRSGYEKLLATDGKKFSYIVTTLGNISTEQSKFRTIQEFGGEFEGIKNIIQFLFKEYNLEGVTLFSPYIHPLNKFFFEICSSWYLGYNRMIKIIDLWLTMKGFLAQMKKKWRLSKINPKALKKTYHLTLSIKNTNENVTLVFTKDNIKIEPEATKNKLSLSEMDMVRLLFGLSPPSNYFKLGKNGEFLDIIFPLDFYIWRNEGV